MDSLAKDLREKLDAARALLNRLDREQMRGLFRDFKLVFNNEKSDHELRQEIWTHCLNHVMTLSDVEKVVEEGAAENA